MTRKVKTQTHQEGTLRVEGVGATHIDAPVAQELQQTDVVMAISLQRATNHIKRGQAERELRVAKSCACDVTFLTQKFITDAH